MNELLFSKQFGGGSQQRSSKKMVMTEVLAVAALLVRTAIFSVALRDLTAVQPNKYLLRFLTSFVH
jgi:hypothetical protein